MSSNPPDRPSAENNVQPPATVSGDGLEKLRDLEEHYRSRDPAFTHRLAQARLGQAFVEARHAAGLSQAAVGHLMGTSQSVVARLESGGTDPLYSTIRRYATAVATAVHEIIHSAEDVGNGGRVATDGERYATQPGDAPSARDADNLRSSQYGGAMTVSTKTVDAGSVRVDLDPHRVPGAHRLFSWPPAREQELETAGDALAR